MQSVLEIEDPGQLADIIAANVLSKIDDRQQVLEEFDDLTRLESVCAMLVKETELARRGEEDSGARAQAD